MPQHVAKLVFWGVRGSTPTVDRNTWRYGGNTPCLELTSPPGTRFILDCGTGLRMLGNHWLQSLGERPVEAYVLVTHYHWDHIQGIPFFHPFFGPQNRFQFFSFQSEYLGPDSLRQVLEAQLASPYFPVAVSMMSAARQFREISDGESFDVHATHITARWLNHPQGCLGYRLETPAGTIVYATDNEPGVPELDKSLRQLAEGADIYVHDAQYSPEQVASSRKGWGHSSWLEGVKVARESGAKNLFLFHHDPDSSDKTVDGFLQAARQEFPSTWAATEGMILTLENNRVEVTLRERRMSQRRRLHFPATVSGQAEDGCAFEEKTALRDVSLLGASLCLAHRPQLQSELKIVIEPGGERNPAQALTIRGTVVHREAAKGRDQTAVGIVFAEEEPGLARD